MLFPVVVVAGGPSSSPPPPRGLPRGRGCKGPRGRGGLQQRGTNTPPTRKQGREHRGGCLSDHVKQEGTNYHPAPPRHSQPYSNLLVAPVIEILLPNTPMTTRPRPPLPLPLFAASPSLPPSISPQIPPSPPPLLRSLPGPSFLPSFPFPFFFLRVL